mmetsp:Transcript_17126/g.36191  ORF Transcript_17126/g.36191 Transcript_17126/m.36191 type:complete len:230 (+) Transcript_17126:533-1222(+)
MIRQSKSRISPVRHCKMIAIVFHCHFGTMRILNTASPAVFHFPLRSGPGLIQSAFQLRRRSIATLIIIIAKPIIIPLGAILATPRGVIARLLLVARNSNVSFAPTIVRRRFQVVVVVVSPWMVPTTRNVASVLRLVGVVTVVVIVSKDVLAFVREQGGPSAQAVGPRLFFGTFPPAFVGGERWRWDLFADGASSGGRDIRRAVCEGVAIVVGVAVVSGCHGKNTIGWCF